MGNCPLNPKEEDEGYAEWLVIPFDRPVQVAARSIVGLALISIMATFVIPEWPEGPDLRCAIAHRGISRFRVRASHAPE
jgi:predicted exporter